MTGRNASRPHLMDRVGIMKDLMMSWRGGDDGGDGGKGDATETPRWCAQRWVQPIGMVSSCPGDSSACINSILATCDSVGGITIINSDRLSVAARHKAFPPSAFSSSSSPWGGGLPRMPTHTRGGRINVDIDTCLSANNHLLALVVGGRERGARLLDMETGKVVWRAKNLPPDPGHCCSD
jgi:hypothetical protein